MSQTFANNAATTLSAAITSTATSITVADGSAFPLPAGGSFFLVTLVGYNVNGAENAWEIVKVTARSGNTLAVVRAQEGTAAQAWPSATLVEARLTAGSLDLKANLASPALTGTPTTPTPAPGTNTTQIANAAFVQAALAALVDSSPGTLDTLNELAAALGDDPNFATTMTNALAAKAPLASPTFTGDPKAPTPASTDNDTSIATTAFVRAAMALFGVDGYARTGIALNDARTGGWYSYPGTDPNAPGGISGVAFVLANSVSYCHQILVPLAANKMYSRSYNAGTWSAAQELWHTGNLVKQTSTTDTTAGALMAVGAFGLGAEDLTRVTNAELNNRALRPGLYFFSEAAPTTSPPNEQYGVVLVTSRAINTVYASWVHQTFYATSGAVYKRYAINLGAWSPWAKEYDSRNILGTVSQSAGTPTGAIIERGSNANGEYVRWADGTQICWLVVEETLAVTTAYGASKYGSRGWAFPAGFSAQPAIAASARTTANLLTATSLDLPGSGSNTSCNWAFVDVIGTSHTGTARMTFSAVGRWY